MEKRFTKFFLSLFAFALFSTAGFGQAIDSIYPRHADQGDTLTTTITTSGITFAPGSPMGGADIWMQNDEYHYYVYVYSDSGSAKVIDKNHISVKWIIPQDAYPVIYDLKVDVVQGENNTIYTLPLAFEVGEDISISDNVTNTTCGKSNGAITTEVNDGSGSSFTYSWNSGQTTSGLSNLSQGIYTLSITDPYYTATKQIAVGSTNGPSVTESHIHSECGKANGSINITVSSGTPPYTYSWSNGSSNQNLTNLPAGNYVVTVSDYNNCQNFSIIQLPDTNELGLTVTARRYSCTNNTGSIFAYANGTLPYSYVWSNGGSTDSIINIPSGSYSVTVTDSLGCSQVNTTYSDAVFNYYVYLSGNDPNCSDNGSISATPSGGTPPYSYLWNNGMTTQTITGLSGGNYYVTVTDSGGCERAGYYQLYSNYCYNVISGYVFEDKNGDCIFDSSDNRISNYSVVATDGISNYYGYTSSQGFYYITIPVSGTFNISVYTNYYGSSGCGTLTPCGSAASPITFTSEGDTSSGNNFGFIPGSGFDLMLHPGWSSAKPGFEKEFWAYYWNDSPVPFNDTATVVLVYDSNLVYIKGTATPSSGTDDSLHHTISWKVYPVLDSWKQLTCYLQVPASLPLGYYLQSDFYILPTVGDCDSLNNHMHFSDLVTGSHDPNEKDVSPAGGITGSDSVLTYTIHFQNTGTDTTNFVIVKDTLSPYLDPTTVRNLASSNNYEFSISGNGILTWVFNPIYLVDSATNVEASKGFVIFSIKVKKSLPGGTNIKNNATVYFDYNSGVVTNTVTSQEQFSTGIASVSSPIKIYPNPTIDKLNIILSEPCNDCNLLITDVVGKEIINQPLNGLQTSIDMSAMAAGVYCIRVSTAKETQTVKVVKQ